VSKPPKIIQAAQKWSIFYSEKLLESIVLQKSFESSSIVSKSSELELLQIDFKLSLRGKSGQVQSYHGFREDA
jgi:hypothetical protein